MTTSKKEKNVLMRKICCVIEESYEFLTASLNQLSHKIIILITIGFVISILYFFYYIFAGYDSENRGLFLGHISDNVNLTFFPININSPFFLLNFPLILFLALVITHELISLLLRQLYKIAIVYNGSHFRHAMLMLGDDVKNLGWEKDETERLRTLPYKLTKFFLAIQFFLSAIFRKKIEPEIPKNIANYILNRLDSKRLKQLSIFIKLLKIDDERVDGERRYYMSLLAQNFSESVDFFKTPLQGKKFIEKNLRQAMELKVEKADFQLAMFLIYWNKNNIDASVSDISESYEILKRIINKDGSDACVKNLSRMVIISILTQNNNVDDFYLALEILNTIDKSDKKTIRKIGDEYFVKNINFLSAIDLLKVKKYRVTEMWEKIIFREYTLFSEEENLNFKKTSVKLTHVSATVLEKEITSKLKFAIEKERYLEIEAEKRKISESLMAMFAHKFRGPVDSIIFNTQHQHDERIYLDAARTMTGLLEIFSIVSTEPERMVELIQNDVGGTGTPEKAIARSLKLALMQLLALRNIKRMSQHYWQHAVRAHLVPVDTAFKNWCSQPPLASLEKEIQAGLEVQVSTLPIENGVVEIAAWMQNNLINTKIEVSDVSKIRFPEYGRKEALLITIMTEVFVNAIKHTDPTSDIPLSILWTETETSVVFKCINPSSRETRSGVRRGSGRGHSFLQILLEKMQGEFHPDVYQTMSSVTADIPSQLLTGAIK